MVSLFSREYIFLGFTHLSLLIIKLKFLENCVSIFLFPSCLLLKSVYWLTGVPLRLGLPRIDFDEAHFCLITVTCKGNFSENMNRNSTALVYDIQNENKVFTLRDI